MSGALTRVAICTILAGLGTGCMSRLLHPDLGPNPDILVRKWTVASKTQWAAGERGNDRGSSILFENTLIFSNETQGVVALYPGSLSQRWVLSVPKGASTGILAVGDRGYFAGGDGQLYAFKLATGEVLWKYPLRSTHPSLPYFSGNRLYVTTADDLVYALDAGSGQWLWSYRRKSAGQPSITGAASPRLIGADLVVGLSDGYLVGLNPEDGALRWEKKLQDGLRFTDINATVFQDSGVLYVPTYDGELFAIRERDREILWRSPVGGARQITGVGGRLIVPTSDGFVVALEKETGKQVWKFELDTGVPTEVAVAENTLTFGSSDQFLYVLDMDGNPIYRFNAGMQSGFLSSPVWDGTEKRLFAVSRAGNLYCFAQPRGRKGPKNPFL